MLAKKNCIIRKARNYFISGQDLLRRGRGGLRVGNYSSLSGAPLASPAQRTMEPREATLPYCAPDYAEHAELLDTAAHLRLFVTKLFPVAQGVYESGTMAHCLRHMVESALLTAMELALPAAPGLGRSARRSGSSPTFGACAAKASSRCWGCARGWASSSRQ